MKTLSFLSTVFLLLCALPPEAQQTQTDSYTRYELLNPITHSFLIHYDVSATKAGMGYYWNTLRKGSKHEVHEVIDVFTGKKLKWKIVTGKEALTHGHDRAQPDGEYLEVHLARLIPEQGEYRLRISKTYSDPSSYYTDDGNLVFERTLGIKRNSIVLPLGYEVIECNYPSQIQLTEDQRVKISFLNHGVSGVDLKILAKRLPDGSAFQNINKTYLPLPEGTGRDKSKARIGWDFSERAYQNREIFYFLLPPESHSFRLYHDYTEDREGMDRYLNIVRPGSIVSDPSAILLDTGQPLKVETLRGDELVNRGILSENAVGNDTEVVAIWYDALKPGETKRIRITETYTDPNRYLLHDDQLVWDRSFGRNRNTIVLPHNYMLSQCAIPAVIRTSENGLIQMYFVNDRPDNIDVFITAQKRNRNE